MNSLLRIPLHTSASQTERLHRLQHAFAEVCNALAPLVQQTACWNRVALHHMAYKPLRQRFPGLGSQMVCNAIYSVSRTCRLVYQHRESPFNLQRLNGKALPRLLFIPQSPVYFDRHTLSLKDGQVSMFTLDGRMRFSLDLTPDNEARFRNEKLREIVLSSKAGAFTLSFLFAEGDADDEASPEQVTGGDLPEYVLITDDAPIQQAWQLPGPQRTALHP
ncbi:MAG: hypothetical protein IPP44_27805 [Ideonella sp.]|jgi:hypothetical protein|nr:hypothetical protein [Ideonella sp.]